MKSLSTLYTAAMSKLVYEFPWWIGSYYYYWGVKAEAARRAKVDECVARLIEAAEAILMDPHCDWVDRDTLNLSMDALTALKESLEAL